MKPAPWFSGNCSSARVIYGGSWLPYLGGTSRDLMAQSIGYMHLRVVILGPGTSVYLQLYN